MRTISVLLTKFNDWSSLLFYYLTGRTYTHAAISLDDETGNFYSFNWKGFCCETLEKYRRHGVKKSLRLQVEISEQSYRQLQQKIEYFRFFREEFQYNGFGVFCAMLHLPIAFPHKHRYFCSEFVAELLNSTKAVILKVSPHLCLPGRFGRDLSKIPNLVSIIPNVV